MTEFSKHRRFPTGLSLSQAEVIIDRSLQSKLGEKES